MGGACPCGVCVVLGAAMYLREGACISSSLCGRGHILEGQDKSLWGRLHICGRRCVIVSLHEGTCP